jgi:4-carboxymuconolactone decarboxylase
MKTSQRPIWTAGTLFLVSLFVSGGNLRAQDRMPPIPPEKMTEAQKKAVADYKALRGADLVAPPWSVILRVPDLVVPSLEMRLHNLNNSVLSHKLTEFAIFIAARHWTNNWEFNAHYDAGVKAGLKASIVDALVDGRRPQGMAEDEEIVYDFCTELLEHGSVSDATYGRAVAKFGEPGAVEIAGLEGYYAYLSMIMNTARTGVQAGAKPRLMPFPK